MTLKKDIEKDPWLIEELEQTENGIMQLEAIEEDDNIVEKDKSRAINRKYKAREKRRVKQRWHNNHTNEFRKEVEHLPNFKEHHLSYGNTRSDYKINQSEKSIMKTKEKAKITKYIKEESWRNDV